MERDYYMLSAYKKVLLGVKIQP